MGRRVYLCTGPVNGIVVTKLASASTNVEALHSPSTIRRVIIPQLGTPYLFMGLVRGSRWSRECGPLPSRKLSSCARWRQFNNDTCVVLRTRSQLYRMARSKHADRGGNTSHWRYSRPKPRRSPMNTTSYVAHLQSKSSPKHPGLALCGFIARSVLVFGPEWMSPLPCG